MSDPNRIYVPDGKHSPLGPSGSDRWMNCKGSVNLIAKLPRQRSSDFAEEGTAAHAVLARCLQTGEAAWMQAGKTVTVGKNDYTVDEEMVEGVQVALDTVAALQQEYPDGFLYVERELSSALDPDAWGAGDITYEVPGIAIFVPDFKYGAGVVVEPTKPQMKMYGYMAYEMRGPEMQGDNEPSKIIVGVIQPRIPHPDGFVRWKTYDVAEVEDWFVSQVLPAMEATRDPQAILTVGPWCDSSFCEAYRTNRCPAIFKAMSAVNTDIDPKKLTGEELGDILELLEVLTKRKAGLEEEAFQRASAGESVKGKKLVAKKSNRVFRDSIVDTIEENGEPKEVIIKLEDALVAQFGLDAYQEQSFKTPPNIEELPDGKKFVSRWAYKPNTGLTLAPLADSRPAVRPLIERMDEPTSIVAKDGEVVV